MLTCIYYAIFHTKGGNDIGDYMQYEDSKEGRKGGGIYSAKEERGKAKSLGEKKEEGKEGKYEIRKLGGGRRERRRR